MRAALLATAALLFASGCGGGGGQAQCSAEVTCPPNATCQDGQCVTVPTGGGGDCQESWNLVENGGFECGVTGWRLAPANADLEVVDSGAKVGARALRLTSKGSTTFYAFSDEHTVASGTLCARAFMRGTTDNDHLRVVYVNADGQGQTVSFSSPLDAAEWALLPPSKPLSLVLHEEAKVHVRLAVQGGQTGQTLEADEVKLWRSADGSCSER